MKSWLQFNHIVLVGRIRIRGTEETPTLVEEKVPSQQELSRILNIAGLREKGGNHARCGQRWKD